MKKITEETNINMKNNKKMAETKSMENSTTKKEEMTLLQAVGTILECMNSRIDFEDMMLEGKTALNYISKRLNINNFQAAILAGLVDDGTDSFSSTKKFADMLNTTHIKVLEHMKELDNLTERGLLTTNRFMRGGGVKFGISASAMRSILEDSDMVSLDYKCDTDTELFEQLDAVYCDRNEDEISIQELNYQVDKILEANPDLNMTKVMMKVKQSAPDPEFRAAMLMALYWIKKNNNYITMGDLRFAIERRSIARLNRTMSSGTADIIKDGIVERAMNDGLAQRDAFCLTKTFKQELNKDAFDKFCQAEKGNNVIIKHKDISKKEMFYNKEEGKQVETLAKLLNRDNMKKVFKKLESQGMRQGFGCLLYGVPGTGKTETVLQLARQSGRDIYEVNISQLRDMWVGESEKNVKQIFDSYKKICENCETEPILFINEADAIFTKRNSEAQSGVDKMENAMQNILLEEMERFKGVMIATTNLSENMDSAFERRFLYKVEFTKPDAENRSKIWHTMLPTLSEETVDRLGKTYDFSGGQIENIARKVSIDNILYGEEITDEHLEELCGQERLGKGRKNGIGFRS